MIVPYEKIRSISAYEYFSPFLNEQSTLHTSVVKEEIGSIFQEKSELQTFVIPSV